MVSVVINYCSIDAPFISHTVAQARLFSDDVIVSAFDHLFSGLPEDPAALQSLEAAPTSPGASKGAAGVRVIVQKWSADKPPKYWHNAARFAGAEAAKHEWVLFLDADEVPEGALMRDFLKTLPRTYDAYSFACYWYFREPIYRARREFECAVMLNKRIISRDLIFSDAERWEYRRHPEIKAREHVPGLPGTELGSGARPMFHHFSWVRTREQLLKKVSSWAHRDDASWSMLVEEEFSRPFSGTDFIYGFAYDTVPNQFGISLV